MSFAGGIISSLGPCSLAGFPLIIGYIGAQKEGGVKNSLLLSASFVLGMTLTFAALGLAAVAMGAVFGSLLGGLWRYILAVLVISMGLNVLDLLPFPWPVLNIRKPRVQGFLGALLVGMIYALIASPCSTPVLAGILAYASLQNNLANGLVMLILYGLGHGLPLLFLGLSAGWARSLPVLGRYGDYIRKFAGLLLLGAGLYMFWTA